MSTPDAIMLAIVLLVGLPAAVSIAGRVRNATAAALVASWAFGFVLYSLTGEGMPVKAMFLADFAVLTVIYAKEDWCDCSPYTGLARQLCALWTERSPWDRAIIAIFPAAWVFYTPLFPDFYRYWALWILAAAQFLLAGWEAGQPWLARMANKSRAPERSRSDFNPAWAYG